MKALKQHLTIIFKDKCAENMIDQWDNTKVEKKKTSQFKSHFNTFLFSFLD